MNAPIGVGWVEPPKAIRGLDHLGVQAPCIALYAQLLPGITNVTDRARYYSFYPWLIRSFEKRYPDHTVDGFRRVLRRAECLFALIAIRHARVLGDRDAGRHGLGMVGRLSLLRIASDAEAISLSDHAELEGANRYFKNPAGGLGQYYFGALRDLRVVDYASAGDRALPGYDKLRGSSLAEKFGAAMPEDDFFRLLDQPTIRWADLDNLADFCPCTLRNRTAERSLLLDLFLARSDVHQSPESANRRASLALALDLVQRCPPLEGYEPEDVFRASAYGRALPDGSPWDVESSLVRAQRGWAVYQRNELLSVALQALFAGTLVAIERNRSGRLPNAAMAGDVCVGLLPVEADLRGKRVVDAVAELQKTLPLTSAWQDDGHEIQRGWKITRAGSTASSPELVAEGVQILLSLIARGLDGNPYVDFEFEPDHFDPREIHLLSFKEAWQSTWAEMTIEEWVRWLAVRWGVQRHLSVALRKLRGERRDTFRIRPLEQELRVIEVPFPAATVPRLGKAFQILRDLDLIDLDANDWPVLTPSGLKELEACRAS